MKKLIAIICVCVCLFTTGCSAPENEHTNNSLDAAEAQVRIDYSTYTNDFDAEYRITDGSLYARGLNSLCLFGEDSSAVSSEWVAIVDTGDVIHVEAENASVIYLTADGNVYALGNTTGIVQEYDPNNELPSLRTPYLISEDCKYASLGVGFVLMLKNDGSVWFQGASKNGQSTEVIDRVAEPKKIADNALFVKAFGYTSAWIDSSYSLNMCGDNSYGQIGNGHEGSGFPTLYNDIVTEPYLALNNCSGIEVLDGTSVQARKTDGRLYAWGGVYGSTTKQIG